MTRYIHLHKHPSFGVKVKLSLSTSRGRSVAVNAQFLSFLTYAPFRSQWSNKCSSEHSEFGTVCTLSAVFAKQRNAKFGSDLNQDSCRNVTEQDKLNWRGSQCRICGGIRQHCNKIFFIYISSALSVIISPRFIPWEKRVYSRASCSTDSLT